MTMLKTFDLKGNKQSFASWISDLSPCETPFTSMVGKESIDQVQYSWQTDSLSKPKTVATAATASKEGEVVTSEARGVTKVHTNFTAILRKVVRVSDTTKKISLYGRTSEKAYQMEKAGMEIKRDLEFMCLNGDHDGAPGTATTPGRFASIQRLVADTTADADTGAVVRKVVTYGAGANIPKFTQIHVFDMTYQLYLAGSRANKIMFHPMHMGVFSDWIGAAEVTPHVHRMFDGMETKYNAHVSTIRDPLGQVYELIPNRYMPKNQLFFFNEADWTQMVLRAPETTELAKNGSSEKHMIEMEVGLRHRNPYASAILEFNLDAKPFVSDVRVSPAAIKADGTAESTVKAVVRKADGTKGAAGDTVTFTATVVNHDGTTTAATVTGADVAPADDTVDGSPTKDLAVATGTVKHTKGARIKVKATAKDGGAKEAALDSFEVRG